MVISELLVNIHAFDAVDNARNDRFRTETDYWRYKSTNNEENNGRVVGYVLCTWGGWLFFVIVSTTTD